MAEQIYDEVVDSKPDEEGYERGLGSRQIQMIAIGGAIGTGLFLGAGTAISKSGPSLILSYAVGRRGDLRDHAGPRRAAHLPPGRSAASPSTPGSSSAPSRAS